MRDRSDRRRGEVVAKNGFGSLVLVEAKGREPIKAAPVARRRERKSVIVLTRKP